MSQAVIDEALPAPAIVDEATDRVPVAPLVRSAIEVLRSQDIQELPDAQLEEDFSELHRSVEALQAELLRRLASIERRRTFEREGHLSAVSWLASRFKIAYGLAREYVRTARALEHMPHAARAAQSGDVSMSQLRILADARQADPRAFAHVEPELVEAARRHSVAGLGRVAGSWREAVEAGHQVDRDERLRARRRLHASPSFEGMVRVDADLDPETGECLLTALRAVMDAEARSTSEDDRPPAQRRATRWGRSAGAGSTARTGPR